MVLPAVIALISFFPQRGSWALAATLGILGASEARKLLTGAGFPPSPFSYLPGVALFFALAGLPRAAPVFPEYGLPIVACVVSSLVAVLWAERFGVRVLASEGAGVLCGLWIGLGCGSFAGLAGLSPLEQTHPRLALLLASVITSDVFAYFTGRAIGRHKLAAQVSPGKTVEGAIGGLVGAAIASALIAPVMFKDRLPGLIVGAGVGAAFAGIVGDLLESLFKRYLGVKDSGSVFPGHGGALDRMDAFLLASPLLYAFFRAIS